MSALPRLRGSPWWIVAAVVVAASVLGAAVWKGWSHSNDPMNGPPPVSLRDIIRQHGGAPGSTPP